MKKNWLIFWICIIFWIFFLSSCKTHIHTFSEDWSFDEASHWHEATCKHHEVLDALSEHHFGDWEIVTMATGDQNGLKKRSCQECGYAQEEVVVHQHEYEASLVLPTCEVAGYTHFVCSCGEEYDGNPTSALGHDYSKWEVVQEPTFENAGLMKRICEREEQHIETKILPVLNTSNYKYQTIQTPNCLESGLDRYTYVIDKETFTFDVILDALGHDYDTNWTVDVAPTCEEDGFQSHHCLRCDSKIDITKLDALGHHYQEFIVSTAPTLEKTGILSRTCTHDSSHMITVVLPVLDKVHYTYESIRVPTCETAGLDQYTYTYDGKQYEIPYELKSHGHHYSEWELIKKPTLDSEGLLSRNCTYDATHLDDYHLPSLNLVDYEVVSSIEASCTTSGSGTYFITIDEQQFQFEAVILALGHAYSDWELVQEPTFDGTGSLKRICNRDKTHVETFELPILNQQDYTYTLLVEGDCASNNVECYTYTKDGHSFDFKLTTLATGHQFGEWEVVITPTSTTEGQLERTCQLNATHQEQLSLPRLNRSDYRYEQLEVSTCTMMGKASYTYQQGEASFVFYVDLKELGHNYATSWTVDVAPTCEKEGSQSHHCSRCDSQIDQTMMPALGHQYGLYQVVQEPTFTETGLLQRSCLHDEHHLEEYALPILNDEAYASTVLVAATCLETGLIRYTYHIEEETFDFDCSLSALGHDYGDWLLEQEPTQEQTGLLIKKCSRDAEHQEEHVLPAFNEENYVKTIKQTPTCLESGIERYSYQIDQCTFDFDLSIVSLGHDYTDGICNRCEKYLIFTIKPIDEATALLDSYDGAADITSLIVPDRLEGYLITQLTEGIFTSLTSLESLSLPLLNGPLSQLFSDSVPASLKQLELRSGTLLPDYAFTGTSLDTIQLADTFEQIGEGAFQNCLGLTSMALPAHLSVIGKEAFAGCSTLASVEWNEELEQIKDRAFADCEALTSVILPTSILSLGENVWQNAPLTSVYYKGTVENWCALSFTTPYQNPMKQVTEFYFYPVDQYELATKVEVPSSVEKIGAYQFNGLKTLETVALSDGLLEIGQRAFEQCSALVSISIPNSVHTIYQYAFEDCPKLQYYEVEHRSYLGNETNTQLVLMSEQDKNCITATLDPSTTIIYDGAFRDCGLLEEVTLHEQITSIGARVFASCASLSSIDLPLSIGYMGSQVFVNMKQDFTIYCAATSKPAKWEDIWNSFNYRVLWGIQQHEVIVVEELSYLLADHTAIVVGQTKDHENLVIPAQITIQGNPYEVIGIGEAAFKNCSTLQQISLPNCIQTIEKEAFKACTSLSNITLPASLEQLGESAFSGCENLLEVSIPEKVTILSSHVFAGCNRLSKVHLKNAVEEIAAFAFYNCSSLTQLILPASVRIVADYAFYHCTALNIFMVATSKPAGFSNAWYGSASVYWYRVEQPTESGSFWHYDTDNQTPVIW